MLRQREPISARTAQLSQKLVESYQIIRVTMEYLEDQEQLELQLVNQWFYKTATGRV